MQTNFPASLTTKMVQSAPPLPPLSPHQAAGLGLGRGGALWKPCPTQGDMVALTVRAGFSVGFTVYSLDDQGPLGILCP